ncbi:MAG: alkaline phosphatase family protein [Victivallales bacterium]|nr:alkaline phosphatase family protein [Victivallales bacterium]
MALQRETRLSFSPFQCVFPAVTCTAAATMRTALPPSQHGIICNGRYDRSTCKTEFWCQSAKLVRGGRIWDMARKACRTVGMLFTQQNLGESVDFCMSPAPIHKHHGGMMQALQCKPSRLESEMTAAVGRRFKLQNYWGPMACGEGSKWCAECTAALMSQEKPDILFSYLPHLDYCLLREGPNGKSIPREADLLGKCLGLLLDSAKRNDYEMVVWGDYSITEVSHPIHPNRALLNAGLFEVRTVQGRQYPNLYDSGAFALCDHQVAHVFCSSPQNAAKARSVLENLPGVAKVQTPVEAGLDCPECGDLVLTAAQDSWFAYSWWEDNRVAPDYATHVDIHNKIGFDPAELFWGFPFLSTCLDFTKVRGSHGRSDAQPAFAVTNGLSELRSSSSLLELSKNLQSLFESL